MSNLEIPGGGTWVYESREHGGICAIAGDVLTLTLRLEKFLSAAPDVCEVEAWIRTTLATPTTVEAFAVAARNRWQMAVRVRGVADGHGAITLTLPADLKVPA